MSLHRVVIIGGGFGGLYAARALRRAPVEVTLIDRRNFHVFQPLLYQIATGGLSPGDITSPLRRVLRKHRNIRVWLAEATGIDPVRRRVILRDGEIEYDTLIVAAGASHHYFGRDDWAERAPGLKTIEDATDMRRRILLAFEAAEREEDPDRRRAWLNFVIVGAGPTGVELAGALSELSRDTLKHDFRSINPAEARILLLEGTDRVLPTYPPDLSAKSAHSLKRLGVIVRTKTFVTEIADASVTVRSGDKTEQIVTRTVLWAAGVKAVSLARTVSEATGATLDSADRVVVEQDLSVPSHPEILIIGDMASFPHQTGSPLPGVAAVAMQQGGYAAKLIKHRLSGRDLPPFQYFNRGSLATIGRSAAVADFGRLRFSGFPAWLLWLFVHLMYLCGFENRLLVLIQWGWNYFSRDRGTRIIAGDDPFPLDLRRPPQR